MKRFTSTTAALALICTAPIALEGVKAQGVDPKIHKLCVEAKDYAGCVRSMKGETTPTSRVINSQGADLAEGNKCPAGFAYLGGGNCQEVKCQYHSSSITRSMGHDSLIAGLKDDKGKMFGVASIISGLEQERFDLQGQL